MLQNSHQDAVSLTWLKEQNEHHCCGVLLLLFGSLADNKGPPSHGHRLLYSHEALWLLSVPFFGQYSWGIECRATYNMSNNQPWHVSINQLILPYRWNPWDRVFVFLWPACSEKIPHLGEYIHIMWTSLDTCNWPQTNPISRWSTHLIHRID